MSIRDFPIRISDEEIADLHRRLDNVRWGDELNDADWSYGADMHWIKRLCDYWRTDFDWRAQEAQLQRFEHFIADTAGGQEIHFIHHRSRCENARPLVITHGWPGSVFEFMKIIEPLADPAAHGGRTEDAFHVVCPSLPGFGFSPPPTEPGMDPRRAAACQVELMKQLGYSRYIAQGGDWGALISTEMGRQDPENCAGVHLNMLVAMPPADGDPMAGLSDEEKLNMQTSEQFSKEGMGYFHIQSTKPQTLSYALNDSPVGLAAWIAEKFRAWSDCDGDVEKVYTLDELLANISLYWFTRTAGSSARMYYETMHNEQSTARVEVPTGAVLFPRELMKAPRKWAEAAYNIVHWSVMSKGGHFAAMEQPELLVGDIRSFAACLKD